MNSPTGQGFFANIASKFPFGQSDQSNPVVAPPNANFPASKQLEPKNNNSQVPNTGNEPNNDPNNNPDPNKGTPGSQLDSFKDLFTIPTDSNGQPIQPKADPLSEPIFKLDPKALSEAARKANFTAGLDPELVQKAQEGDSTAFMQVLNTVAQNGFLGAVNSLTNVVETAVQKNNQRFEAALPDRIRSTQISQAQPKHPALSHKAASPMVSAMKAQIAATNPHLNPDQVASMAERYFLSFAEDISAHNQREQQATAPKPPGEVDWSILGS